MHALRSDSAWDSDSRPRTRTSTSPLSFGVARLVASAEVGSFILRFSFPGVCFCIGTSIGTGIGFGIGIGIGAGIGIGIGFGFGFGFGIGVGNSRPPLALPDHTG